MPGHTEMVMVSHTVQTKSKSVRVSRFRGLKFIQNQGIMLSSNGHKMGSRPAEESNSKFRFEFHLDIVYRALSFWFVVWSVASHCFTSDFLKSIQTISSQYSCPLCVVVCGRVMYEHGHCRMWCWARLLLFCVMVKWGKEWAWCSSSFVCRCLINGVCGDVVCW